MADKPKPEITPPPIHLEKQLIIAAIIIVVLGIVIILAGKLIIGGILALLGAVFGLGTQVSKNNKL